MNDDDPGQQMRVGGSPNIPAAANMQVGQMWYDTSTNLIKVWDGTAWIDIGPSSLESGWCMSDDGVTVILSYGFAAANIDEITRWARENGASMIGMHAIRITDAGARIGWVLRWTE